VPQGHQTNLKENFCWNHRKANLAVFRHGRDKEHGNPGRCNGKTRSKKNGLVSKRERKGQERKGNALGTGGPDPALLAEGGDGNNKKGEMGGRRGCKELQHKKKPPEGGHSFINKKIENSQKGGHRGGREKKNGKKKLAGGPRGNGRIGDLSAECGYAKRKTRQERNEVDKRRGDYFRYVAGQEGGGEDQRLQGEKHWTVRRTGGRGDGQSLLFKGESPEGEEEVLQEPARIHERERIERAPRKRKRGWLGTSRLFSELSRKVLGKEWGYDPE